MYYYIYNYNIQYTANTFTKFIPNYIKYQSNNNQFNSQLNISSQNNIYYENQIKELKRQLNEEKNKNQILINENINLKNTINNLNNKLLYIQNYKLKIKSLENEINQKNYIIQQYQLNNENNQTEYSITSIKPGEKIMAINFAGMGYDIGRYCLSCKNTDLFVRLEERLYKDFPDFKDYEIYFEVNTRRIKRFKTLEENKIKNNDIINIFGIDK